MARRKSSLMEQGLNSSPLRDEAAPNHGKSIFHSGMLAEEFPSDSEDSSRPSSVASNSRPVSQSASSRPTTSTMASVMEDSSPPVQKREAFGASAPAPGPTPAPAPGPTLAPAPAPVPLADQDVSGKQEVVSAVNEAVELWTDDTAPPSADPIPGQPNTEDEGRVSPTNIIREKFEQVRISAYVATQMEKTHSNEHLERNTIAGLDHNQKVEEGVLDAAGVIRESADPHRITEAHDAQSDYAEQQAAESRRELEEFKAKELAAQAKWEGEIEKKRERLDKEMEEVRSGEEDVQLQILSYVTLLLSTPLLFLTP